MHWNSTSDGCAIADCIPVPLLIENGEKHGVAFVRSHVRSRLTNVSSSTSSDSRHCAFFYDMMNNATASHEDCRLMLNRGLIVGKDRTGGLALRGKGDSTLSESFDEWKMVKNLCASQKCHM